MTRRFPTHSEPVARSYRATGLSTHIQEDGRSDPAMRGTRLLTHDPPLPRLWFIANCQHTCGHYRENPATSSWEARSEGLPWLVFISPFRALLQMLSGRLARVLPRRSDGGADFATVAVDGLRRVAISLVQSTTTSMLPSGACEVASRHQSHRFSSVDAAGARRSMRDRPHRSQCH